MSEIDSVRHRRVRHLLTPVITNRRCAGREKAFAVSRMWLREDNREDDADARRRCRRQIMSRSTYDRVRGELAAA